MSEPTARQIAERFYTHLPAYRRDSLAEAIEQRVATLTADLAQAQQERETLKDERDEARLIVALVNNEVIGSAGYFTTPSCVEAVQRLKLESNRLVAQLSEARRQVWEEAAKLCLDYCKVHSSMPASVVLGSLADVFHQKALR